MLSGKVEYHQGDALDLGVIWTDADRTLHHHQPERRLTTDDGSRADAF